MPIETIAAHIATIGVALLTVYGFYRKLFAERGRAVADNALLEKRVTDIEAQLKENTEKHKGHDEQFVKFQTTLNDLVAEIRVLGTKIDALQARMDRDHERHLKDA